ncbi:MAG: V-type ATP synthase subunit I [Oscillospiraceae bacterium]|nr:V-type ATP synthase subunit I [Oscillospiraceae bacterium]
MAILKMDKAVIYGLHANRKSILEELHKREIIDVSEVLGEDFVRKETGKSISQFENILRLSEQALEILGEYVPEKSGLFSSRKTLGVKKYNMNSTQSNQVYKTARNIVDISDKIRESFENIRTIETKQAALAAYTGLDAPLNVTGTESTSVKAGLLYGLWTEERIKSLLAENELDKVYFEILSASKEYTSLWFVFAKSHEQNMRSFLLDLGFSEPLVTSHHLTEKKIKLLNEEIKKIKAQTEVYETEIKELCERRRDIELLCDHMRLRIEKYQVLGMMGMTEHTFTAQGYIPKEYSSQIKELLESKYSAFVELSEPDNPEDAPVALRNNSFSAPVEEIVATYSMPSGVDIDPTPIVAFFYYLFFGMMFGDAGYGLMVMAACGYLGFSSYLEKKKRKNYQMFFYCGVSTTLWGLMYGSFFGDIIDVIPQTFFGVEYSLKPLLLNPVESSLFLLIFSVSIGLVHVLIGLSIKFYMLIRQKKIVDAVLDIGLWGLVLLSVAMLGLGMGIAGAAVPEVSTPPLLKAISYLGLNLKEMGADSVLSAIGMYGAIIGGVGLVITGGRKSPSIPGKVIGGVVGLYDITGYVSDSLSYCRLMALGLASGVIGNVVNLLGSMGGASVVGVIMLLLVGAVGHLLNFAINMLGAYVHTNRLQYVEFFSKFYEGGGRKYTPFSMDTKYYVFSED